MTLHAPPDALSRPSNHHNGKPGDFPIVGIGASAGGLEALEQFLRHVPEMCGMAFVIVQHQDPTRKGNLVELLQHVTPMPVVQIKNRQTVEPNRVYVIPSNKDLSLLDGVLHLLKPTESRGLRLPIDFFFRSLAADRRNGSIGVILSGMGSDGVLGIRAIKETAGVALVQDPASAKFDSMPRSAIDAGLADIIAPAEELPDKLVSYLQHFPSPTRPDLFMDDASRSGLEKVLILLRTQTGHDFSLYKKNVLYRRIERRMGLLQLQKLVDYVRYLRVNPQEIDLLLKELLIGVTSFFRDPVAWEQLKTEVFPAVLAAHSQGGILRAWCLGCSTGEEAYSLAMVFKEVMDQVKTPNKLTLQVYATDPNKDAIERARNGLYPANISADVSEERLSRFFFKDDHGGFRVSKEIRDMVIFATHNLTMDPPFTRLDILTCRNLLIYLTAELQKKLLPLFHYSLVPGGCLFLGSAETIGAFSHLFAPLPNKMHLYRRLENTRRAEPVEFPSSFKVARTNSTTNHVQFPVRDQQTAPSLQPLTDHILLQQFSPPAVLTTGMGDILYISGRIGKYLEPAAGKVNWNIFVMAREGLRYFMNDAFQKALDTGMAVTNRGGEIGSGGDSQFVDITVCPLQEPEALRGMVLVVFTDVAPPPATPKTASGQQDPVDAIHRARMELELRQAREEMRVIREETQVSQEELKSINEELQFANEELTTSKEEMQSMNEELQVVNHELQAKVDEITLAGNDMKNLLDSTDIATIFLDVGLRLRRFTTQASRLISLIPGDIGRPITNIASFLIYPGLAADTEEVLRTQAFIEKKIAAADGRWFLARIMPYRTLENRNDGVVVTFTDITECKQRKGLLLELAASLRQIMEDNSDAFFILDESLLVSSCNRAAERMMCRKAGAMLGKPFFDLCPEVEAPLSGQVCRQALREKTTISFDLFFLKTPCLGWHTLRIFPCGAEIFVSLQKSATIEKDTEA